MSPGLTEPGPSPGRRLWAFLGFVTVAGLVVRATPVLIGDFPVNDGGLFMAMVLALEDAGWNLPAFVAWNGRELPFAYPPLGFYLAAGLDVLGADLFSVFRWLPLAASTLVVPAVFLLARELLRSDIGGAVAALGYALAPASYVWLIQGGGVTRSPGMLLAVLCLWLAVRLVRDPGPRIAVGTGLLAGLTALTHPGAAVFVAVGGILLWIFEGRTRAALRWMAVALVAAAAVAAPWAFTVVARHGVSVLTDVPSNGPSLATSLLALGAGRVTGLPFLDPIAILGTALALLALIRRQFLLPIWLVVATAISYQYGMIPLGLLLGGFAAELANALRGSVSAPSTPEPGTRVAARIPVLGLAAMAGCFLFQGIVSAATVLNPGAPVHSLSPERREGMDWVSAQLPDAARVAVITDSGWSGDPDSEWFPLLAARASVATVQGSEWLGAAAFNDQVVAHGALQACVSPASVSCVEEWLTEWPADYLFLPVGRLHGPNSPEDCCADLRSQLHAAGFEAVYEGRGATVFRAAR